eukprot:scaffold72860_cov26-Tisochrysis_lutea.AAC.3
MSALPTSFIASIGALCVSKVMWTRGQKFCAPWLCAVERISAACVRVLRSRADVELIPLVV